MTREGLIVIFHLRLFSALLPPKQHEKSKLKKRKTLKKNHLQISSFQTSVPKIMIMCYTVPEIQCVMDANFIFNFWLFFALLHMCNKIYDPYGTCNIMCKGRTNERKDRKSDIQWWVRHRKKIATELLTFQHLPYIIIHYQLRGTLYINHITKVA